MNPPAGYISVQHADDTVHAIALDALDDNLALWRNRVVCDASTGVSSDENAGETIRRRALTCSHCIAILSTGNVA